MSWLNGVSYCWMTLVVVVGIGHPPTRATAISLWFVSKSKFQGEHYVIGVPFGIYLYIIYLLSTDLYHLLS